MAQQDYDNYIYGRNVTPGCKCDWCQGQWITSAYPIGVAAYAGVATGNRSDEFVAKCKQLGGCVPLPQSGPQGLSTWQHGLAAWLPNANSQPFTLKGIQRGSHAKTTGHNCTTCNSRNDYAEANQGPTAEHPNGTYKCFDCR